MGEKKKAKGKEKREKQGRGERPKREEKVNPEQNFWLRPSVILMLWCHATLVCPYVV